MKIVLGEKTKKLEDFAYKISGIIAFEMCGIKFIKEVVDLYIPYEKVLDSGFIENTSLYLEEVLLTLKVRNVYYGNEKTSYLEELAKIYQVSIYTV